MKNLISVLSVGALLIPVAFAHGANLSNLNGLTTATQFLIATTSDSNLSLKITSSSPSTHFFQPVWTGTLQPARGGTGLNSFSVGDILYASGTTTLARLGIDTAATRYLSNAGASSTPTWSQINLSNGVTSTLSAQNGGTGNITFSKGDILVAQTSTTLVKLTVGQDGQVLMASSTAPLGVAWVTLSTSTPGKHFQVDTGGTLTTNLISYWQTEGATDFYGTNDLINSNSVTFTGGKVNSAGTFVRANPNTQSLYHTDNASLSVSGDFTFAFWIKVTDPSLTQGILAKWAENSSTFEYSFYMSTVSSGVISFNTTTDGNSANQKTVTATTFGAFSSSTYYFVAGGFDSANNQIWISVNNGAHDTAAETAVFDGTSDFSIGSDSSNFNSGNSFGGQIDEIGFWKKKLSATELTDLYNGGSGQTMNP